MSSRKSFLTEFKAWKAILSNSNYLKLKFKRLESSI